MKKVLLKSAALLVALVMAASPAGCAKKTGQENEPKNQDGGSAGTSQNTDGKVKLPIVDTPVTLKILAPADTRVTFNNEVPVFKELEKRTNVKLEWELLPAVGGEEKFNLIMMSGKLPDIISYPTQATIIKYAQQGAFIPLEGEIKKYAPNINSVLNKPPFSIPNLKAELTAADGHIYTVPMLTDNFTGELLFIREDWLKNVNMKKPETTDELYSVLKAFKEKDPNGNGKQDEIPFSPDSKELDLTRLMNAFGAHRWFYVAKDNTIKFGPVDEKERQIEGIKYINKLYSEGLIDPEYLSHSGDQFKAKTTSDTVGMIFALPASGADFANNVLQKNNPDKRFVGVLPPKGPHGDSFKEDPQAMVIYRMMITKDNKNVETTMKWLDYLYSEEGRILMNFGIEGETYTMVNGEPQYTDFLLNNPEMSKDSVQAKYGIQKILPFVGGLEGIKETFTKEVKEARNLYEKSGVVEAKFPNLQLSEEDQAFRVSLESQLTIYMQENVNKFFIGAKPISEYDSYIDGIKKMNLDKLLKIYNDAYKKYLEFNK